MVGPLVRFDDDDSVVLDVVNVRVAPIRSLLKLSAHRLTAGRKKKCMLMCCYDRMLMSTKRPLRKAMQSVQVKLRTVLCLEAATIVHFFGVSAVRGVVPTEHPTSHIPISRQLEQLKI